MPIVQGATLAGLCREVSVEPTLGAVPLVMKCRLCCDCWVYIMALAKISSHRVINEVMSCYRGTATQIAECMATGQAGAAKQLTGQRAAQWQSAG